MKNECPSVKYAIIGNSTAAIAAAEGIREIDSSGSLMIISREDRHTYSRPLITYLLGGKVDESKMTYRPQEFYQGLNIETRLGTEVVSVEAGEHRLKLSGGEELTYEKLLIATGGRPVLPPVEGSDLRGVFSMTCWDDVEAIRSYIKTNPVDRAVVVGAGMIGIKTIEALRRLDLEVTALELAERPLSMALDETAGQMVQAQLASNNVDLRCGTTLEKLLPAGEKVAGAVLSDGHKFACQLVVFAIGVRPDTSLLQACGAKIDRGIIANQEMLTSLADVYVAGDCTQSLELLSGQSMPIPILPVAYRQGRVAGANMAGGQETFNGSLIMNSISVFDLPTISVGLTAIDDQDSCGYREMVWRSENPPAYRKVIIKDKRLVGAVLVGQVDRAGIFTGLIKQRVDISSIQDLLLTEEFGVLALPTEYRKHLVSGSGIEV
jgi:NAD(P)H-nitrite reductase large subunit